MPKFAKIGRKPLLPESGAFVNETVMKRIFLSLFLLSAAALSLRAEVVSAGKARVVAENFLQGNLTKSGGSLQLVWTGEAPQTKTVYAPAYYVFAAPEGGFVVVSGDDRANPVLGYSYTETFKTEGMPENISCWFAELRDEINALRDADLRPADGVVREWADAMQGTKASATVLPAVRHHTANYNQGRPYNLFTPTIGGKTTYTGCSATALTTICEYWRWPRRGKGTIPAYNPKTYDTPIADIVLGYEYDWDNILHDYGGSYTNRQAEAVSRLMYDIGVAGESSYGTSGTAASAKDLMYAAVEYFGFSAALVGAQRASCTEEEWVEILKKSLSENGPIYYTAQNSAGGHAFVVDGYDSRDYFHFNWGWGGSNNGYYRNSVEYINGPHTYNKSHRAWLYLHPGTGTEDAEPAYTLTSGTVGSTNYYGLTMVANVAFTKGASFKMKVGRFSNIGYARVGIEVRLAHCDKDGEVVEFISGIHSISLTPGYTTAIASTDCRLDEEVKMGDFIRLYFRKAGEGDSAWRPMPYNRYSTSVTGEIAMTGDPVGDRTSMTYAGETGRYRIVTDRNALFSFYDAEGNDATSRIEGRYGQILVDVTKLEPGTWRLVISNRLVADDRCEISFIVK